MRSSLVGGSGSGSGIDGPVTEMARIGLRGDIGAGDLEGEGEEARIWRETLDTVAAQKGCTNSYYGGTLEDNEVLVWCIEKFKSAMHKLHAEKKIAGFLGVIDSGEVIEKIAKNKEAKEEEKGRALVIMIGWESKEAHLAFRETKEFAESTVFLRKGTSGADMFHVAFKNA
ncbi:hypothetical protein H4I96_05932 [Botrytis cinerea]